MSIENAKETDSRNTDRVPTSSMRAYNPSSEQKVYSICMTSFNASKSVKFVLDSILSQIDERFEVVVVDNESKDGSLEMLKEYNRQRKIRLIVTPCSRGLGREIAIKHAKGDYILIMDMDDVFEPKLANALELYHKCFEGIMLLVSRSPGLVIAPKLLIENLGGYRDLNWLEDSDLYSRAAEMNTFRFIDSIKIISYSTKDKRFLFHVAKYSKNQYMFFRDSFRLKKGFHNLRYTINLRLSLKDHPFFLPVDLIMVLWGFTTHYAYPCYTNNYLKNFSVKRYKANA